MWPLVDVLVNLPSGLVLAGPPCPNLRPTARLWGRRRITNEIGTPDPN